MKGFVLRGDSSSQPAFGSKPFGKAEGLERWGSTICIALYPSLPIYHNLSTINRRRFRSWEIQLRRLGLTSPFARRLLARGSERQGLR